MTIDNPFAAEGIGVQYARGRPYHHPVTLGRALALLGVTRAAAALDVACGTGLSTRALADVADRVAGCEVSPAMLSVAPMLDNVSYVRAAAESMPFARASFDGATVASAVHWFDQGRFFAEMHRVLRPGGWLVLYDHYFLCAIRDVPEADEWGRRFSERYPLPPRSRSTGETGIAPGELFEAVAEEFFDNDQDMDFDAFVDYVCSQSNAVAAGERREPVREWVIETAAPLFAGARRAVRFLSAVTCFRRLPR